MKTKVKWLYSYPTLWWCVMLMEEGKRERGKKEGLLSVFFIANTLFLSGKEVKRQIHISANLRRGDGGHSCHLVLFLTCLSPLCSLPFHQCLALSQPQHDTDLLSTKVKDQSFDCTNIHPPHLARHSPFQKHVKYVSESVYVCIFSSPTQKEIDTCKIIYYSWWYFSVSYAFSKANVGERFLKLMAIVLPNKQTLKSYRGGSGCQNP